MVYNSKSIDETKEFAKKVANNISIGSVIALIGDLGTGKTTFTQGFANEIGIKERVGSPTFKLVSEYKGFNYFLYHIDAYRLKGVNEFLNIGGEDYLNQSDGITIIEWADIIAELLGPNTIIINFSRLYNKPNKRKIKIEGMQFEN
tara:strand:+ start:942 stop:1379 length:438 start_codon:yes stop_codon:yes gene_type:complete